MRYIRLQFHCYGSPMLRPLVIFLLVCLTALSLEARDKSFVRLHTYSDFPPFIDKNAPGGGLYTTLVRAAYEEVGMEVKVEELPWSRIKRGLVAKTLTGSLAWSIEIGDNPNIETSTPLFAHNWLLYTNIDELQSVEDLQERRYQGTTPVFCVPQGWTRSRWTQDALADGYIQIVQPSSLRDCFDLLLRGRAHVVYATLLQGRALLGDAVERGIEQAAALKPLPYITEREQDLMVLAFSNSDTGRAARDTFNIGLTALIDSGRYNAIVETFIEDLPEEARVLVQSRLAMDGFIPYKPGIR